MDPQRTAVIGCGTAGAATAIMLARAGHEVTVFEAAPDPGPVGAGIWLQGLGQGVLDDLGILDSLRTQSRSVDRVRIATLAGRTLMDFGYRELSGAVPALGVRRGTLFSLLWRALQSTSAQVNTGVRVTGVRPAARGVLLEIDGATAGPYDLVVGADGSTSAIRSALRLAVLDRSYSYGALWATVDDPDELAGDTLLQCLDGTTRYLGVLPTGRRQASIFWSVKSAHMAAVRAGGLDAWRAQARPYVGPHLAPLVDGVDELLEARYRDVVVRAPYRLVGGGAVVLLGDAAHSMSPQLGAGTSLALADAASLCHHLRADVDLSVSLPRHAADRRAHIRWYSWCTRLMMPVFQSDLRPLARPRDRLAGPLASAPWIRRHLIRQLTGAQIGLSRQWQSPATTRR